MKTINNLIRETCNARKADKEIERNNRIEEIYTVYPQLERLDEGIIRVRGQNLIRIAEKNLDISDLPTEEEKRLDAMRKDFIAKHCIDPAFDEEKVISSKCSDTGFIKKKYKDRYIYKVCGCMQSELEEAYEAAGLGDFSLILPSAFDPEYIEVSEEKRINVNRRLTKALTDYILDGNSDTYIYTDGVQTGKTFLSVCFAKVAIELGCSVMYMKIDNFGQLDLTEDKDKINFLKDCDFLLIDDFASIITGNNRVAYLLNMILEARQAKGLISLVISNETKEMIVDSCDERIAGKLRSAVRL